MNRNLPAIAGGLAANTNVPKAYLIYILFNNNFSSYQIGYQMVSISAQSTQPTPTTQAERMTTSVVVPAGYDNGYLCMYTANESNVAGASSVYFDDMLIRHIKAAKALQVTQVTDYYPFGLAINPLGYQKSTTFKNDYLYNGKEFQDDFTLNWLDYGARMFMPEIGRWGVIDAKVEILPWLSPYRFAFNNPIRFNDMLGQTEEERIHAIDFARRFLTQTYGVSILGLGYTLKDNGALDCAGLVRLSIAQATSLGDFFFARDGGYKTGSGVQRIMQESREASVNEIRQGDVVVMESHGDPSGHTGFITNVVKGEKGNTLSCDLLHSEAPWVSKDGKYSGGGTVNIDHIDLAQKTDYAQDKYNHRYFQWDTPSVKDDLKEAMKYNKAAPAASSNMGAKTRGAGFLRRYVPPADHTKWTNTDRVLNELQQLEKSLNK
jgi:RHS repeat-associated protein